MYCKKCGTEQKDGQKFCPKCGTPYLNVEQNDVNSLKEDVKEEIELPQIDLGVDSEKEQVKEYKVNNNTSETQPLSEEEEKKVRRIAKAGMWIITIAIVLTFVNAGFGFSFWWYLYLIIMAIIALLLLVMSNTNDSDKQKLNTNDSYLTNIISWIGAIMLAILYLWGPLNTNYVSGSGEQEQLEQNSYSSDTETVNDGKHVLFNSEQDVRTYLCTHRFSSNDGYTLSFSNNANEISVNGKLLTSNVDISLASMSSAIIRTHGPYGNTTFRLATIGSDCILKDSDGEVYFSNK